MRPTGNGYGSGTIATAKAMENDNGCGNCDGSDWQWYIALVAVPMAVAVDGSRNGSIPE